MNIAQALKHKNRLSGELNRIKNLIVKNNSVRTDKKTKVNIGHLFRELSEVRDELIDLKGKINVATAPIAGKLAKLAEMKSEISWYDSIPSREGKVTETIGYRGDSAEVEYETHLTEVDIEDCKKVTQETINKLQDQIDEYNYTTKI